MRHPVLTILSGIVLLILSGCVEPVPQPVPQGPDLARRIEGQRITFETDSYRALPPEVRAELTPPVIDFLPGGQARARLGGSVRPHLWEVRDQSLCFGPPGAPLSCARVIGLTPGRITVLFTDPGFADGAVGRMRALGAGS